MNEQRTASMLQRVPVILAVTAGSYGLDLQAESAGKRNRSGEHRKHADHKPNLARRGPSGTER